MTESQHDFSPDGAYLAGTKWARLRDIGWLALAGILLSLYMGAMTLLVLTCWGATGWSIVWHLAGFAVLAAIPLWLAREWRD